MIRTFILSGTALFIAAACGETGDTTSSTGPKAVVERIIDDQIIPDHQRFAEQAAAQLEAIDALCAAPSEDLLGDAREAFDDLAIAWSRIEWVNFGPSRVENRRETLFFWPDSRNRGLRQIEELAASDDAGQFEPDAFAAKSVAVRGLPALEYVLFAEGADALLSEGATRCDYAHASAATIADLSAAIAADWASADGYRATMLGAGPDNPEYRNHREVLQKILTAASEQVQIAHDLKLTPLLRQRDGVAEPITPPFSRAGVGLEAINAGLEAASRPFTGPVADMLPEEQAYRAESLTFELDAIERVFSQLAAQGVQPEAAAQTPELREQLVYLQEPVSGAHRLMSEVYPAALGLVMGFNSLDGD